MSMVWPPTHKVLNQLTLVIHRYRILIFSHFSKDRDGLALLECLAESLAERDALPDHVIFTTYIEREDEATKMDKGQEHYSCMDLQYPDSY